MPKNWDYTYLYSGMQGVAKLYDYAAKEQNNAAYIAYMLARTQGIFDYQGLPDTIPARMLELYLQCNGSVGIIDHNGDLYAVVGGLGGVPDAYYMPTIYTVANPYLQISRNYNIGRDCVVIPNDALYLGLLPMFSRYATALVEDDLSLYMAGINSRVTALISAPDDKTKMAAEQYLEGVKRGNLGIIAENHFLDGVRSQPYATASSATAIQGLVELRQYHAAGWYNDVGLDANYNLKRERLSEGETDLNSDALIPLIDNMLECRKIGLDKVNAMFGTSISVSLRGVWEANAEEATMTSADLARGGDNDGVQDDQPDDAGVDGDRGVDDGA